MSEQELIDDILKFAKNLKEVLERGEGPQRRRLYLSFVLSNAKALDAVILAKIKKEMGID